MAPYHKITLVLSPAAQKKLIKGLSVRLSKDQIGTGSTVMVHKSNFNKLMKAKAGCQLDLSPGEIVATAEHHGLLDKELTGAGFLSDLWSGVKKVGGFLKDSGIGTILADAAVPAVAGFLGPAGATVARNLVKNVTGVGLKGKKGKKAISGSGLYI